MARLRSLPRKAFSFPATRSRGCCILFRMGFRSMANTFDLDAYFGRIEYTGPRTPTYETLAGVLAAHVANIPFEVFDVLLGRPIRLDSEGLHAKIITARRGGNCVEHGSLMYAALHAIGFNPVR